jgi:signal transduction histidine kinase/CheY-like chemotaxis protein
LKSLVISILVLTVPSIVLAIDKDEALYYADWIDTIQDNNLTLSKAFIYENPSKALGYISQAIANTENNFLKAKCYIQKGIIYNYSYLNKRDSALENLIAARDIYLENDEKKKLIFNNILIAEVYKKNGNIERSNRLFKNVFLEAKNISAYALMCLGYLAQIDLNPKILIKNDDSLNNLVNNICEPELKAYAYFISHKRAVDNQLFDLAVQYLDSAEKLYEIDKSHTQSIEMLIKKAEIFEQNNNLQMVVQLNESIYEESITHNYGKGLIYSCYKLSDFFESIERYDWANPYLKYINKIEMSEGDRELNERILLAEKEKKIDVERVKTKNELKFQGYLTFIGFGIALFILGIAIYIYFAFKTKSELANNLLLANTQKEKLKKEKDDFLAYTTHEIRTPLSAVISASEILDRTELTSSQKDHLNVLKSSASNILFLVNDILDLAKLEKRKIFLETIPFNPEKVIENAISILNSKALDNNVRVELIIGNKIPENILGDAFRFQQIIVNLLDNAIKYAPGGVAKVRLKNIKNKTIEVQVSDNGKGIEQDKLKLIFQPYAQEKTNTSRQYGGTGLGLAICDLLIELMGGEIKVESSELGTDFTFKIPYEIAKKSVLEKKNLVYPIKELKILMAEDDQLNGQLFKDLIQNTGNNVIIDWVINGEEVMKKMATNHYDIVLMDIEMPLKNGFETSSEIRKSENTKINNIPIIAMTAHLVEDVLERCYQNGMNDCISKPFQIEMLFKKISETIKNIDLGKSMSSNNKGKYLEIFIRTFRKDFKELNQYINSENLSLVKSKLHKMKGSSATMEFNDITECIAAMELKKVVDLVEDLKLLKTLFLSNTKEKLQL